MTNSQLQKHPKHTFIMGSQSSYYTFISNSQVAGHKDVRQAADGLKLGDLSLLGPSTPNLGAVDPVAPSSEAAREMEMKEEVEKSQWRRRRRGRQALGPPPSLILLPVQPHPSGKDELARSGLPAIHCPLCLPLRLQTGAPPPQSSSRHRYLAHAPAAAASAPDLPPSLPPTSHQRRHRCCQYEYIIDFSVRSKLMET